MKSCRQHSPHHLRWFRVVVPKLCSTLCSVPGEICLLFYKQISSLQKNSFCAGSCKLSPTLCYHHLSNVPSRCYPAIYISRVIPAKQSSCSKRLSANHQSISIIQHHPGLASILPGWPSESHQRGTHLLLATAAGVILANSTKKPTLQKCNLARNVTNNHLALYRTARMNFPQKLVGWFGEYFAWDCIRAETKP